MNGFRKIVMVITVNQTQVIFQFEPLQNQPKSCKGP